MQMSTLLFCPRLQASTLMKWNEIIETKHVTKEGHDNNSAEHDKEFTRKSKAHWHEKYSGLN